MEKVTIVLDRECAVMLRDLMAERVLEYEKIEQAFQDNDLLVNYWMTLGKLQHQRILDAVEAAINNAE